MAKNRVVIRGASRKTNIAQAQPSPTTKPKAKPAGKPTLKLAGKPTSKPTIRLSTKLSAIVPTPAKASPKAAAKNAVTKELETMSEFMCGWKQWQMGIRQWAPKGKPMQWWFVIQPMYQRDDGQWYRAKGALFLSLEEFESFKQDVDKVWARYEDLDGEGFFR